MQSTAPIRHQDFDVASLRLGELLQLQFLWDGQNSERYSVKLLGYYKDHSIMVTAPIFRTKKTAMQKDLKVNVRINGIRSLCAFASIIESIHTSP